MSNPSSSLCTAIAGTIEPYFGIGNVTKVKQAAGRTVLPNIAVQTAASSAAHLTKGSNITDPLTSHKKLIVDDAIYPVRAAFDYSVMLDAPKSLTVDGGLPGWNRPCLGGTDWSQRIPPIPAPLRSDVDLHEVDC